MKWIRATGPGHLLCFFDCGEGDGVCIFGWVDDPDGLYDNYRPTFCSIMDSCSSGGYGKVNVEGFAVGSIQNQGFYEEDDIGFIANDAGQNSEFQIILDAS